MKRFALLFMWAAMGFAQSKPVEKTQCEALVEQKQYQQAVSACTEQTTQPGASPAVWVNLGSAQYHLKNTEQAVSAWETAVRLDPSTVLGWQNMAQVRWEKGDKAGAMELYDRAVREAPQHTRAWRIRGSRRCEMDMSRAPDCIRDLTKAIELDPTNATAYWQRGDIRAATGDRAGADADYRKSLEIRPTETAAKQRLEKLEAQSKSPAARKQPGFLDRLESAMDAIGTIEKTVRGLPNDSARNKPPASTPPAAVATSPAAQSTTRQVPEAAAPVSGTQFVAAYAPPRRFSVRAETLEKPDRPEPDTLWAPWTGAAIKPPVDIPFADVQPSLDSNDLTPAQYNAAVITAMEGMRAIIGPMTPEEEKKFGAKWAPLLDFPCKEVTDYLNKLNPLLGQAIATRSALMEAADMFNDAYGEATTAASVLDDEGVREAMEVCRLQSQAARSLQARMDKIAADIEALGEVPNPLALKTRARQTHQETLDDLTKARFKFTLSPATRKGAVKIEYKFRPKPARAPKGIVLTWSYGDGSNAKSGFESTTHAFAKPGKYVVKATALDTVSKRTLSSASSTVVIEAGSATLSAGSGQDFPGLGWIASPPIIFPKNLAWKVVQNGFLNPDTIVGEAIHTQRLEDRYADQDGRISPVFALIKINIRVALARLSEAEVQQKYDSYRETMDTAKGQEDWVGQTRVLKGLGAESREVYRTVNPNFSEFTATDVVMGGLAVKLGKNLILHVDYSGNFENNCQECTSYGRDKVIRMKQELYAGKVQAMLDTIDAIRLNTGGEAPEPEEEEPEPALTEDERRAKEAATKERIAFHETNIHYFNQRLTDLNNSLASTSDPAARESLKWQIMVVESNLQQEKDHIETLKTGEWVHTRTRFDDYCLGRMIERGSEEARRWSQLNRALAAIPRQLALLPPAQRDQQKAIIDRLVTPQTIASGDFDTILKAAGILSDSVKGYWQAQADQQRGDAEWADRKLALAEDLKSKAGTSMMVLSFLGGGGVYAAYMGATGYIDGGPVKAIRQAASTVSTATLAISSAYDGYNQALTDPRTGEPLRDPQTGKVITAGLRGAAWEAGKVAVMALLMQRIVAPALNKIKNRITGPPPEKWPTVQQQIAEAQFQRSMADGRAKIKLFQQRSDELAKALRTNAPANTVSQLRAKAEEAAKVIKCTYSAKLQLNQMAKSGNASPLSQYLVHDRKITQQAFSRFEQRMTDRQWSPQQYRTYSNSASNGKAGIDVDYGVVEPQKFTSQKGTLVLTPEYLAWRRSLTKSGQRQPVRQFQEEAQRELKAAFDEVIGGPGRPTDEAFVNFTTSGHSEAYRSLAWIGSGENATADFSQITPDLARQAGDVTSFKLGTVAAHNPTMTPYKAMQEQCRTLVKDLDTKLIGTKQTPGPLANANAGAREHVMRVRQLLDDFSTNRIGPLEADRKIRELTGGEGMDTISREFRDLLTESVMRGAPKTK